MAKGALVAKCLILFVIPLVSSALRGSSSSLVDRSLRHKGKTVSCKNGKSSKGSKNQKTIDDLLIYYGFPTCINGCGCGTAAVECASAVFGLYDMVVLGDGLQNPTNTENANVVAILASGDLQDTTTFGYIDLGVSTQNLDMERIRQAMDDWKATGADGIFLDDFGYDWLVTRERQNAAVDYAHSIGLSVIANAFRPEDAFGDDVVATFNPLGLETSLGKKDFYLYESYQIITGAYLDETSWRAKADTLQEYQDELKFGILSITTNDATNVYDEDVFFYAWYSAVIDGHVATGWGEYIFSAVTAQAPFHTRPDQDFTLKKKGKRSSSSSKKKMSDDVLPPLYTLETKRGNIFVNAMSHEYGFVPKESKKGRRSKSN